MNSSEKLIAILKRLGEPPYELGITELSKEMEVTKSGIHKIVSVLVRENLLIQNPATKKYSLGPVLFRLGNVYSDSKGIGEISFNVMESIASITKTNVFIGIREGDDPILAYKIPGPDGFIYRGQIGSRFPFYASAMGKLLTAYLPEERINHLLKTRDIVQKTPHTITEPDQLIEEYQQIRTQGFAISIEENRVGAYGIAVPIKDKRGFVWCCLCIAGSKDIFTNDVIDNWRRLLQSGAEEISYRLGFRSS